MKQIKTITNKNPRAFDEAVNEALRDGWTLTERGLVRRGYYAALERNDYVPEYASCGNCAHDYKGSIPTEHAIQRCRGCKEYSRWELSQDRRCPS